VSVCQGEKIPRKGGPAITRSDLLVINKVDLAPHVGADLAVMEADAQRARGTRPVIFTDLSRSLGVGPVAQLIARIGGLQTGDDA
jgi:urease accessory protein